MPSLARAFNAVTTRSVTHERSDPAAGSYVNGNWVPAPPVSTPIRASVQPLSGKEYDNLPSTIRNEAQAKCLTRFALVSGDRIIDGTARYKVLSVDNWQSLGGFTKAILGALQ
ncbi:MULTISPECIES: phage head completion protein [unclassified Aurantimonas]|uniref:phage head completion protein n=1 Tax=unclassified Aurantimonas TaxID=2638230 RepID=UPI002E19E89C|nr:MULTISPECIES: head-tail adaptor protein [unclassified Aurantimonas]MEC5289387.1 head-tail adaptor protein [Aurantimonas sp. C2-3-R2]MEC5410467.1 head-tail adaptor protein [Aurantimonas sp. C2-4-R8]